MLLAINYGSFSNSFLLVLTTESTTQFLQKKGDELQNTFVAGIVAQVLPHRNYLLSGQVRFPLQPMLADIATVLNTSRWLIIPQL
ncbi:MAG: hypothetical protein EZS28_015917 [Streblomastix strix]|uniref:Uncharacterized protein n=2 Tax=Streblomastix strix TaxID=222440 RepID=A0A5J4W1Y3_9EUKA|nr:MAG: hypothetical protein EZS28_015917 [Streblomastix strix]